MTGLISRDDLALEGRDQPQHAVGRRVVRAEVEGEQLLVLGVLEVPAS